MLRVNDIVMTLHHNKLRCESILKNHVLKHFFTKAENVEVLILCIGESCSSARLDSYLQTPSIRRDLSSRRCSGLPA